ncbi:MAG: hypothetical protein Q7K21_00610, partial [Elusimicrobiota bacterium]|nr:hypothetical protein [Elusimicrobiota bacterium]
MKKVSVLFFYFFVSSFLGYAQDEQKVVVLSEQGNKTWNEFKDMINKRTKVYQSSEDEGMKAYFLVDPLKNSKEESAEQVYKIILWYRSMDNLSKIFELI